MTPRIFKYNSPGLDICLGRGAVRDCGGSPGGGAGEPHEPYSGLPPVPAARPGPEVPELRPKTPEAALCTGAGVGAPRRGG